MATCWVDGVAVVEKVSSANKDAYRHVVGQHEVLVNGVPEFVGTYAECVQFRDDTCNFEVGFDAEPDDVWIVPWFDTSDWVAA